MICRSIQKKAVYALLLISVTVLIIHSTSFSNQDDLKVLQNESLPQEATLTNIYGDLQNISIDPVNYLNNIVKDIAKDSSIYDLIGFSIGMVIYGIFVYHFYKFLSKRDMFSINLEQRMIHIKLKSSGEKISTVPRITAFIATNIFIFPFVIFLWFLGYSSFMFLLVQQMPTATIFLVSSSLIIAIRISAYYSEELSKVIDYVEQLKEVNTDDVEPTAQITGMVNQTRADKVADWDEEERKNSLQNNLDQETNQIKVPRVLNN